MARYRRSIGFWLAVAVAALAPLARAAKIGDVEEMSAGEQLWRFVSLQDDVVRTVLLGAVFLGISCGVLGSFIVVRRLSLFGDTLSHAVLPGVAMGYLIAGYKSPVAIFVGATVAGVVGTLLVSLIKKTTHLKEDSSLGMVLAGFYGIGIVLLTRIQDMSVGNQAGLDKFLFGQAAALSREEVTMMGVVALLSLLVVGVFYRQLLVGSFDGGFARSLGLPSRFFQGVLMTLLTLAVVVSLQAVGAVLVSAMLIVPASAAYLLTDRMHRMLALACLFGVFSGVLGAFFSFLGNSLPTGPLMVLAASFLFGVCFLFSPRHGVVSKFRKRRSHRAKVRDENTLKAIFQVREQNGFSGEGVDLGALADRLDETHAETKRRLESLRRLGIGDVVAEAGKAVVYLKPEGWLRACAVVRNHRLWELYLTNQAHYEPDHVHEDAEKIEHVLGEDTVRQLERLLDFPTKDPHGKLIPSLTDLQRTLTKTRTRDGASGYRMPRA